MGQLKLHSRQLVAEVFKLMDEMSSVLVYDNQRLVGKITYDELVTFLNYKKDVGNIYYHKLHFELGTALHLIREMRTEQANVTPDYVNKTLLTRFISLVVLSGILLGVAWWYYQPVASFKQVDNSSLIVSADLIGADKTVLNLGGDKNINITDAAAGTIYSDRGLRIEKTNKGQIVYHLQRNEGDVSSAHMIRVPKGASNEVMLTDGSKIWLNAASSIKFSTMPASSPRNLTLTGEAYFEVAHDKLRPFVVFTKGQQIQVLGTHFNVNAYSNEANATTTLLEGSVKVLAEATGQSVLLKPGEQAIYNGKKISVITTDAKVSAAWKDGEFLFRNMPLQDVMRIIERWYDVKVIYQKDSYKKALLGGTLMRSAELDEVLHMLEITSNVHFLVEGKTITVIQ